MIKKQLTFPGAFVIEAMVVDKLIDMLLANIIKPIAVLKNI